MIPGYPEGRVLLDTNVFLWASVQPESLSPLARQVCASPGYELVVSPASAWELVTKAASGKLDISDPAGSAKRWALSLNAVWLDIKLAHIASMARLPWLHKDPFDRILMGQSSAERIPLLTSDGIIRKYSGIQAVW